MVANIAAGIVAIAKAIPAFQSILTKVVDLFTDFQIEQIEQVSIETYKKRNALINSIAKADSNEDRKALSIMLANLNRLSDS